MKKIILFLAVLVAFYSHAQKKPKIKGNKEVLIKKFMLPAFSEIEVGEKFEIELQKSVDTTRVVIETDDNLFDVIHFKVENSVLKFYTIMEIVKKKRLKITVFIPEYFHKIKLVDKGKVFNKEVLDLKSLQLEAVEKGKADLYLNLKDSLSVQATGKTDLKLDVNTRDADIILAENASVKGKLNAKKTEISLDDHTGCKLEGSSKFLKISALSKSKFEGVKFEVKEADVLASGKSKVFLNVSGKVDLKLSGETETELYGSPKINLNTFKDNAVLYKK